MKMKRIKDAANKLWTALFIGAVFVSGAVYAAEGGGLATSKIATGITQLLNDASAWLMGISAVAGIVAVGYCFFRKTFADEQDQKKWADKIKMAIFCALGGLLAGAK